jgi:hypothetical protein
LSTDPKISLMALRSRSKTSDGLPRAFSSKATGKARRRPADDRD